jgi:glycosyltransferase involved in cell wall biosynthesis
MRIGIYAPNMTAPPPSGVERYVAELLRALAARDGGHEFVLFTDSADVPASGRWRRVDVPRMGWLGRLRYDHGGLARAARKERLDVLHCTKSTVPAGLACPSVVTVYDVIFLKHREYYPAWWRWYWSRALERTAARADAIVCISETTARDLEEFVPDARRKVHAVPIGVNGSAFRLPEGPAEERRAALGVRGPYFLYAGNITARKNIPVLLDAFEAARAALGAGLVIVGGADYGAREVLGRMNGQGLRYLARVGDEDLAALYGGALALVYPSQYEGFGLPVLEAMACGCPVIASRGGALPEVVGEAGCLVEPGSAADLADALRRLAGDPELRRRLAEKGRARAAEFTWERTAARTLEIYERAAR